MNRDEIEGGLRNLRGRGRTALGAVGGRARPQLDGAYEQVAGLAQSSYGRAQARADRLRRDGHDLAEEAVERGRGFRAEAFERGRALRDEANGHVRHYRGAVGQRGRALVARAEDNKGTTLALVAVAAFGLGWLLSQRR